MPDFAGSRGWSQGSRQWGKRAIESAPPATSPAWRPPPPPRPPPSPQPTGPGVQGREGRGGSGERVRSRAAGRAAHWPLPDGPTYLSASSLSPSSASAIPSKLRPTSRPIAQNPSRSPRPTRERCGRCPRPARAAPRPGLGGLLPLPGRGPLSPQTYFPRGDLPWDQGVSSCPSLSKGLERLNSFTPFPKQPLPQETWAARIPFSFP